MTIQVMHTWLHAVQPLYCENTRHSLMLTKNYYSQYLHEGHADSHLSSYRLLGLSARLHRNTGLRAWFSKSSRKQPSTTFLCPVFLKTHNRTSCHETGQSGHKPYTWQPYRSVNPVPVSPVAHCKLIPNSVQFRPISTHLVSIKVMFTWSFCFANKCYSSVRPVLSVPRHTCHAMLLSSFKNHSPHDMHTLLHPVQPLLMTETPVDIFVCSQNITTHHTSITNMLIHILPITDC